MGTLKLEIPVNHRERKLVDMRFIASCRVSLCRWKAHNIAEMWVTGTADLFLLKGYLQKHQNENIMPSTDVCFLESPDQSLAGTIKSSLAQLLVTVGSAPPPLAGGCGSWSHNLSPVLRSFSAKTGFGFIACPELHEAIVISISISIYHISVLFCCFLPTQTIWQCLTEHVAKTSFKPPFYQR